ncbi:MAG: InlB B-repeat-containing protein, partial [Clostridia bacterium]|nr:InlB B-repeat-containing protein [Clostridia bacterium]
METKKVLSIIFSLLFVGAFAFVLVWGITNFNKVQEGLSGTGLYTQEDSNKAYEDGYDKALTDKAEYEELINSYRDTITTLTDQVTLLTYANQDCETQIKNLTETKQGLETQVANLTSIKKQNEATITSLNAEIVSLEKQVKTLTESNEDKDEEIAVLKNQIANLQALISQLQTTNALNVETINSLNAQITNLNAQISDLTMQLQNNSSYVIALQNRIAELERTVAYYEQYIANLENGEQVVATFEFAGSVYNIQILAKNSIATVTTPTSTDYVIFNYWTVDGVQVDLSTYQVQTNIRFVANVTYKYDVKFMVNNELYNSQVVVKNGYPTLPANPVVEGYEFDGWTTNGVDIVKPNTSAVIMNTTYYAKLTKLHTVTFMYEDWVLETQQVRNGNYANAVSVENTNYKTFNGWLLNGAKVDLSTYKITGAETFVADIIYSYDVEFISDGATYNSQIIAKNNKVSIPNNPTKQGYEFDGWTVDGSNIVNLTTYSITENTTFVAKFTKIHTVTFIHENNVISIQQIRDGEYASFVNVDAGYNTFDGWAVGGNLIDCSTYE